MTAAAQHLSAMPSPTGLYFKAAGSARRKPKGKPEIPALKVEMQSVPVDAAHLAAYREICGFETNDSLPIIYPQIMAQPLIMHLMTQPSFPLPLLGLVHLRNHIEQLRPLRPEESFDISAHTGEARDVKAGLEFDMISEYKVGDQIVWRCVMTILFRMPGPKGGKSAPPPAPTELSEYRSFDAPGDIGRRYAKVSGDYNPIHLYGATAKLFGFPRAIAHGLWSMARCCALLLPELGTAPKSLSVQFKQPLLLPGKVALKFQRRDGTLDYALLARGSDKVHLSGSLR